MKYSLVSNEDGTGNITVVVDGEIYVARADHACYDDIVEGALSGDDSIVDLFDISSTVAKHFESLSDRLSVAHGRVFVDGDEINNALTQAILRSLDEGVDDWKWLVLFYEKILANPNKHSREQAYAWLENYPSFTLTKDGNILAYKGVDENYNSIWSGGAIVDGTKVSGKVPNKVGSVIEVPRSSVQHDPAVGCSYGLHVATHAFATGYGSIVLGVEVNPRDIVSVPTECQAEKMRVCRYKVRSVVHGPERTLIARDDDRDYTFR